jgi:hypothetical protein
VGRHATLVQIKLKSPREEDEEELKEEVKSPNSSSQKNLGLVYRDRE